MSVEDALRRLYEQKKEEELLANIGKGKAYTGRWVPPWWEFPPMPPDPLGDPPKHLEWLPLTTFLLNDAASAGGNFAVSDYPIPVHGASKVIVDYVNYNADGVGGNPDEVVLYIDTSWDPPSPRRWAAMASNSYTIVDGTSNQVDTFTFASSDANPPRGYIRWRLANPSSSATPMIEMSIKVSVIRQD